MRLKLRNMMRQTRDCRVEVDHRGELTRLVLRGWAKALFDSRTNESPAEMAGQDLSWVHPMPPRGFSLKPSTTRPGSWQRAWALAAAWREQWGAGDAGAGRGGVGEWVG